MYLAKTKENRSILAKFDIFNMIITNLMRAYEAKQRVLVNASVGALAYFSFDRPYRILLSNAN